ncbi:hypothetical protein FOZ63_000358 [Perkinsus olseni]|uniref:DUF7802 domain-containing protein n=1 Tax=Perkinsus olseni TaxID=32597 RepID=A0A7J6SAJ3_PEROL|nr:hypothetical protein FOZ63_000358 [Perkinsus olseni]
MTATVLASGGSVNLPDPLIDTWALTVYNPLEMWKLNPCFVAGEALFYILGILTFAHACVNRKSQPSNPVTLWIGCFLGGSAVEFFTSLHPQIDNALHSQACIVLTERIVALYPLLGLYGALQYMSLQLAFSFSTSRSETFLSKIGFGLIAGLIGHVLYELLDATGTYFLWWTWHEGDPAYLSRRAGVPLSSGFWIYAQIASLGLVYAFTRYRTPLLFIFSSIFVMPVLFVIPFVLLFHPLDELYGQAQLATYIVVSVSAVALLAVLRHNKPAAVSTLGLAWLYVFLMAAVWTTLHDTAGSNLRYSYGQPFANRDCRGEMEVVGWGTIKRERYLCPVKVDEDVSFTLKCLETYPADESEWYWVCGKDVTHEAKYEILLRFVKAVVLLLFLGLFTNSSKKKSE